MIATQSILKPEGKKLRRKLQKIHPQQPPKPASVRFAEPPVTERSFFRQSRRLSSNSVVQQPQVPAAAPPPDLSDAKWQEYLRKSTYNVRPMTKEPMQRAMKPVAPEFAHLRTQGSMSPPGLMSDSSSNDPNSSTSTLQSSIYSTRRQAKTPIQYVGQLESKNEEDGQPNGQPDGLVTDVEALAESYRALLVSRNSLLKSRNSARSPSIYEDCVEPESEAQLKFLPSIPADLPPSPKVIMGSPASSDDGTLIGFEDTIYFKPTALASYPTTPLERHRQLQSRRESILTMGSGRNPSLDICLDLLSKELLATTSKGAQESDAESSALQLWVMIEAYEKLRGDVIKKAQDAGQRQGLETTFDLWLEALYDAYDQIGRADED